MTKYVDIAVRDLVSYCYVRLFKKINKISKPKETDVMPCAISLIVLQPPKPYRHLFKGILCMRLNCF